MASLEQVFAACGVQNLEGEPPEARDAKDAQRDCEALCSALRVLYTDPHDARCGRR